MSDHVFREVNGELRFIGDFDALYREEADPWGQSGQVQDERTEFYIRAIASVTDLVGDDEPGRGLDVGCGLGYSTAAYAFAMGGRWSGCDISMEAIRRAREIAHFDADGRRPHFFPADITLDAWPFLGSEREAYGVVIWSHLFWYIMDAIEPALRNSMALLKPGGTLVITQAVMRGEQRYGRELADGHEGIIRLVAQHARAVGGRVIVTANDVDGPWMDHTLIAIQKDRRP